MTVSLIASMWSSSIVVANFTPACRSVRSVTHRVAEPCSRINSKTSASSLVLGVGAAIHVVAALTS